MKPLWVREGGREGGGGGKGGRRVNKRTCIPIDDEFPAGMGMDVVGIRVIPDVIVVISVAAMETESFEGYKVFLLSLH